MNIQEHRLSVRHHELYIAVASPTTKIIGTVQLIHGLAEHSGRYGALIEALVSAGYQVLRHDHVTHGQSRRNDESLGHWTWKDRWQDLIDDCKLVYQSFADKTVPYVIIGHSMGSIIARELALQAPHPLSRLVLLGSLPRVKPSEIIPAVMMGWLVTLLTRNRRSPLLNQLIGRNTNDAYPHPKGWLTTDEAVIEALADDPNYGFIYTAKFYLDFFRAIRRVNTTTFLRTYPCPVLFMSGDDDPAGRYGQGVSELVDQIRSLQPDSEVTLLRYPNLRHELHNEVSKQQVFDDLLQWLH